MCLYLPYLHFDTYKVLVRRRALVKKKTEAMDDQDRPSAVAKLDSLEFKVLWQYLGHDPPINARRTLDQFGYPSLLETRARDDDQMLYKMTKERFGGSHGSNGRDKMVEDMEMDEDMEEENYDDDDEVRNLPRVMMMMAVKIILRRMMIFLMEMCLWLINSGCGLLMMVYDSKHLKHSFLWVLNLTNT